MGIQGCGEHALLLRVVYVTLYGDPLSRSGRVHRVVLG